MATIDVNKVKGVLTGNTANNESAAKGNSAASATPKATPLPNYNPGTASATPLPNYTPGTAKAVPLGNGSAGSTAAQYQSAMSTTPSAAAASASSTYVPLGTYFDAGLGTSDAALVKGYQDSWAKNDALRKEALANGNTALAAQYQAAMDNDHANAEAVRAKSGYSGGMDGSDIIALQKAGAGAAPSEYGLYNGADASAYIKQLNAAQIEAATQALKSAYEQNMNAADYAASQIPAQYQAQRNAIAAQNQISRGNLAELFAANGLNNGAVGQMYLSQENRYQGDMNANRTAEAQEMARLDFERLQLKTQYQNAVAQAIADGNADKAEQLYSEFIRLDNAAIENSYKNAQLAYNYANLAQDQSQFSDTMEYNYSKLAADSAKAAAKTATGSGTPTSNDVLAKMIAAGDRAAAVRYLLASGITPDKSPLTYQLYLSQYDAAVAEQAAADEATKSKTDFSAYNPRGYGTEGMQWNGAIYNLNEAGFAKLLSDISAANLTDAEKKTLIANAEKAGFPMTL